jgi:hypothetical protein
MQERTDALWRYSFFSNIPANVVALVEVKIEDVDRI